MTPGVGTSETAESQSDEVQRRLAEVDALRRRVLNVIPHALRTPITTFRGLSEALVTATDDEVRTAITPALRRLAAQAERLLDDMLLASGLSTTLPTGPLVRTSVADTARAVWGEVGTGELSIDGDDAFVEAPANSFPKILVHVLDNAAKYGNSPPTVVIRTEGDRATVSIDSPGPEVVDVDKFGEPFFRGERAVTVAPGLGVGLAVARVLAEHAGGRLTIAKRAGGGVVTTVELRKA